MSSKPDNDVTKALINAATHEAMRRALLAAAAGSDSVSEVTREGHGATRQPEQNHAADMTSIGGGEVPTDSGLDYSGREW